MDFATKLRCKEDEVGKLRMELKHCKDRLRQERVLSVVRGVAPLGNKSITSIAFNDNQSASVSSDTNNCHVNESSDINYSAEPFHAVNQTSSNYSTVSGNPQMQSTYPDFVKVTQTNAISLQSDNPSSVSLNHQVSESSSMPLGGKTDNCKQNREREGHQGIASKESCVNNANESVALPSSSCQSEERNRVAENEINLQDNEAHRNIVQQSFVGKQHSDAVTSESLSDIKEHCARFGQGEHNDNHEKSVTPRALPRQINSISHQHLANPPSNNNPRQGPDPRNDNSFSALEASFDRLGEQINLDSGNDILSRDCSMNNSHNVFEITSSKEKENISREADDLEKAANLSFGCLLTEGEDDANDSFLAMCNATDRSLKSKFSAIKTHLKSNSVEHDDPNNGSSVVTQYHHIESGTRNSTLPHVETEHHSDGEVTPSLVLKPKKRAWQFVNKTNSKSSNTFKRSQSIDHRLLLNSNPREATVNVVRPTIYPHLEISEVNGCSGGESVYAGLLQNDSRKGNNNQTDGVSRIKIWIPHNRTEPVVKAVPPIVAASPNYDEMFDRALVSKFPSGSQTVADAGQPLPRYRRVVEKLPYELSARSHIGRVVEEAQVESAILNFNTGQPIPRLGTAEQECQNEMLEDHVENVYRYQNKRRKLHFTQSFESECL